MGEGVSHKEIALLLLMAGCAVPKPPTVGVTEPPDRWRVAKRSGLVVLERERLTLAQFEVRCSGPARPGVGEAVSVEVWVPGAYPHERHRFRVRPSRTGVRAFAPEEIETKGDQPAMVRFTADVPGPGGVTIEPVR